MIAPPSKELNHKLGRFNLYESHARITPRPGCEKAVGLALRFLKVPRFRRADLPNDRDGSQVVSNKAATSGRSRDRRKAERGDVREGWVAGLGAER